MLSNFLGMFLTMTSTTRIIMIVLWTIVVIGAIIIEAETSELVSCWFALGGLICLVLAVCRVDLYIQIIVFACVSIFLVIITRPLIKKFTDNEDIPTNADRVKGMVAIVTKDIINGEKGQVKVNYQLWTAICKANYDLKTGDKVLVQEIEAQQVNC